MATATTDSAARKWWRRIAWLVAIWAASVVALGAVSLGLRFLMAAVGLSR